MGKTGKWFKNILSGKKHQSKQKCSTDSPLVINSSPEPRIPSSPVVVPRSATPTKDKKRWSFRRSSATSPVDPTFPSATPPPVKNELAPELAVGVPDRGEDYAPAEETAALKIQSVFRSYLARKALKALRGLVKLQALVRGHLVRKQATATLRCMQALVTAQARARAQRIRSVEDAKIMMINNHRHSTNRRSTQHEKFIHPHFHDMEENIKIVEMDHAEHKIINSYLNPINYGRTDDKISTYYTKHDVYSQHISPAPSATTDLSPRTCSGYYEEYSFPTAQTSPQCYSSASRPDPSIQPHLFAFPRPDYNYSDIMSYDYPLYPNYMSNTKSSRAKARSQSAPKQRPEYERQPSRGQRPSVEGRGIPKGARMQRSSSQVGSTTGQTVQYPCSVKLDKSMVSIVHSECGSNYSALTANANNYCNSVVSYDPRY